ncbi:MAG: CDP-alcohol phosphatidyltransferase family protein [Treponema sp.]|nr:CDP-alcohol phosphatidyltransferase family protein [Candidatus Treponema equi]
MLGVYNYTVWMTYVAMIISFVGISYVLDGNYKAALLCLMVSGVLDMFDGKVASTKKDRTDFQKNFGIQIDSMSDLICYGVLPAMIVYELGRESSFAPAHNIVTAICACYLLCALIRLAFFNVDEAERQKGTSEERHLYLGLPVTSIALILPAIYDLCNVVKKPFSEYVGAAILIVCGIAFISPFKLVKPNLLGKMVLICVGLAEIAALIIFC